MSSSDKKESAATVVNIERDTKKWEVEMKAEIPAAILLSYRATALKEIQKTAKIDGFRPGHAPESEIIRIYGESAILRRAADDAIQKELPEILASQKLFIIETPRVTTEIPERGMPLAFTATAALAPEINLPDYKIVAKNVAAPAEQSVTEEEHEKAIEHLRRERARIDFVEKGKSPQEAAEESRKMEEKDLPLLDEEWVKSIGYESVSRFQESVRENMQKEKERQALEARRSVLLDELAAKSDIKYPEILANYELDDMEARLKDDLERMGSSFDAYLSQIKKTREEIRSEWKPAADKRAKIRLILTEIARKENIEPKEEDLAREIEHARLHYKDADPNILRSHIAHAMRNEETISFLENIR